MKNKFGFTLAEVLITLTIIGVIAALTIPNLMQRYQEQTTVNKVKKFYSTLSNAYSQAQKEYGTADEWGVNNTTEDASNKIYGLLFKPYFKISKNCGTNNSGGCIPNVVYKQLNNVNRIPYATTTTWGYYYSLILNDGSLVWFRSGDNVFIFIDVNGKKEPNKIGVDMFVFSIKYNNSNIIQFGDYTGNNQLANYVNSNCLNKSIGWGCSAWLIYKGNMDYLHCNDLSWNGKNKCR